MKKIIKVLLSLVILVVVFAGICFIYSFSSINSRIIDVKDKLALITRQNTIYDDTINLQADLTFNNNEFVLSNKNNGFKGKLNGNGYTITLIGYSVSFAHTLLANGVITNTNFVIDGSAGFPPCLIEVNEGTIKSSSFVYQNCLSDQDISYGICYRNNGNINNVYLYQNLEGFKVARVFGSHAKTSKIIINVLNSLVYYQDYQIGNAMPIEMNQRMIYDLLDSPAIWQIEGVNLKIKKQK